MCSIQRACLRRYDAPHRGLWVQPLWAVSCAIRGQACAKPLYPRGTHHHGRCPHADNLFEEVAPAAVLDARANENGTRDFLVKWPDGAEDSWVRKNPKALQQGNPLGAGAAAAEGSWVRTLTNPRGAPGCVALTKP